MNEVRKLASNPAIGAFRVRAALEQIGINMSHSELGGYLLSAAHAPAGTKRLSKLLRAAKWRASLITRFLWQRASEQLKQWQQVCQGGLLLWDESGWEKPESWHLDDLGPTRASQAARGPIFVPGLQWLAVLLVELAATWDEP